MEDFDVGKTLNDLLIDMYPMEDMPDEGPDFSNIPGFEGDEESAQKLIACEEAAANLYGLISVHELYKMTESWFPGFITEQALQEALRRLSYDDTFAAGLCPAELLFPGSEDPNSTGYLIQWDLSTDPRRVETMKAAVKTLPIYQFKDPSDFLAYARADYQPNGPYYQDLYNVLARTGLSPDRIEFIILALSTSWRKGMDPGQIVRQFVNTINNNSSTLSEDVMILAEFLRHSALWSSRGYTCLFEEPEAANASTDAGDDELESLLPPWGVSFGTSTPIDFEAYAESLENVSDSDKKQLIRLVDELRSPQQHFSM